MLCDLSIRGAWSDHRPKASKRKRKRSVKLAQLKRTSAYTVKSHAQANNRYRIYTCAHWHTDSLSLSFSRIRPPQSFAQKSLLAWCIQRAAHHHRHKQHQRQLPHDAHTDTHRLAMSSKHTLTHTPTHHIRFHIHPHTHTHTHTYTSTQFNRLNKISLSFINS